MVAMRDDLREFVPRGKDLCARAVCSICSKEECVPVPFRCGVPQFQRIFTELHWDVDADGTLICPDCCYVRRKAVYKTSGGALGHFYRKSEGESVPKEQTTEAATSSRTPNLKEQREIFAALERHFVNGAYQDGKTDSLIAAEIDVPTDFVRAARIAAFGSLKHAEYDDVRADLDKARVSLNAAYAKLAKLEAAAPK